MKARIGIAPIAWWNDDLEELSEDVSLEECFRQVCDAGYEGLETGRRFPRNATILCPILDRYDLALCGGWFSGKLLAGDIEAEKERIAEQMELFIAAGAPCIVYGETAGSIQGDRNIPLASRPRLDDDQISVYGRRLTDFAEWCADAGMPLSYHHHMAAPIETEAELDLLMGNSGAALPLLLDTGHMAFAGGDILRVIERHHARIRHVHLKDVRQGVMGDLDRRRDSFLDAVVKGVFTVPGDGSLDFDTVIGRLASFGYEGWFVVEAEQDPVVSPPREMAEIGYREVLRVLTSAGYSINGPEQV